MGWLFPWMDQQQWWWVGRGPAGPTEATAAERNHTWTTEHPGPLRGPGAPWEEGKPAEAASARTLRVSVPLTCPTHPAAPQTTSTCCSHTVFMGFAYKISVQIKFKCFARLF